MNYTQIRTKIINAINEIQDSDTSESPFAQVVGVLDSSSFIFPTCTVLAGSNSSIPLDSCKDSTTYVFDLLIYDERQSEVQTYEENEDRMLELADLLNEKMNSLEVDYFGDASFSINRNGGFGYDEIIGARVRFYRLSLEVRVLSNRG